MASSRFSIAVHALALLAHNAEAPLKSEFIACSVKTNAVVIRRLLADLARADFVVSQAGAAGGTRLAKNADEINLFAVYKAVEDGEVFALHRKTPSDKCDIGRSIQTVLTSIQNQLDLAIEESLGKITVADVVQMIKTENRNCNRKREREQ